MDPYEILNVDENDSIESIKAAYHKLILKFHPDKSRQGDTAAEQFMAIQKAWKTICDIDSDPATYKTVNSDEVPFSELQLRDGEEELLVKMCRCGELYEVYVDDLHDNVNTFQCNGCTLYITICDLPEYFL